MCVDLPLEKKIVENQDWATGPSWAMGRWGPLGCWAVAGRWAAGLLLAKPNNSTDIIFQLSKCSK